MIHNRRGGKSLMFAFAAFAMAPVYAEQSDADVAKDLNNPVASLISVPIQFNYDQNIGKDRLGKAWTMKVQPVIPIESKGDWNVISRTIVPVVSQEDIFAGGGDQFGLGDIAASVYFSPKAMPASGWLWGAGPVLNLPTATNKLLGTGKWGAGPAVAVLKQDSGWTYGALFNHISSFAGDSARSNYSISSLQPFLAFTNKTAMSFGVNTESTYDWKAGKWYVPINATVSQLTKIGDQRVSFGGALRYVAHGPDGAPHGWGARFIVTLVFPK